MYDDLDWAATRLLLPWGLLGTRQDCGPVFWSQLGTKLVLVSFAWLLLVMGWAIQ